MRSLSARPETGSTRLRRRHGACQRQDRCGGDPTPRANPTTREVRHMTTSRWNDPADDERNPHRAEERRRTRDELEARLRERRVELAGDESDDDVMLIVNAVETFEGRLAQLGEDSFVNTPESSEPDDSRLVVPRRFA